MTPTVDLWNFAARSSGEIGAGFTRNCYKMGEFPYMFSNIQLDPTTQ